jgi:hypothetical protein
MVAIAVDDNSSTIEDILEARLLIVVVVWSSMGLRRYLFVMCVQACRRGINCAYPDDSHAIPGPN